MAQQPEWTYDSNGKITGYKTSGGADTVFPFRGGPVIAASNLSWSISTASTTTKTKSINVTAVAGYQYLTSDNFFIYIKSVVLGVSDGTISFSKSYNAATGTLILSAKTTADSWGDRSAKFTFDVLCC